MPEKKPRVRLLLQQCTSAQLDLSDAGPPPAEPAAAAAAGPPGPDTVLQQCSAPDDDGILRIGPGLVLFVCFLSGCDEATARRAATRALSAHLSESPNGSRVAVTCLPGDILVLPQATLGGKRKDNKFQYHGNASTADGARLYAVFVEALREAAAAVDGWTEAGCRLRCGRYGVRLVLSSVTNGPFLHVIET